MYSKENQLKKEIHSELYKKPKKPRSRKCLTCRKWFTPEIQGVTTCSPECAIAYGKSNFGKQKQKEIRKAKQSLNKEKYSVLFNNAKKEAQKYARLRDYGDPCISCGCNYFDRQIHGGHFENAGNNKAISLNLCNIHAQCVICNDHKSGNYKDYEINLRKKIGDDKVEWLKTQNQSHRFTNEYLKRYTKIMRKMCRRQENRLGLL